MIYLTFNILTLKEERNRNSRGFITKLGFDHNPDSKQHWEVPCHSTIEVPIGKRSGPREQVSSVGETSKDCSLGSTLPTPIYNSKRQTGIIINLWANSSTGFMLMLLVLSCKTWNVVRPGAWLARPPPGAQQSQFSCSVMSDSLRPHEPQHARPPCLSPTPGVHPNPCPLSWWRHPTISSSVVPFSSCPQSFPASGSFPISQLFASGSQSIGVSASTLGLPIKTVSSMVQQVLHSQQAATPSHPQLGQNPGSLEARSEACSVLPLKPKQDYLFNFLNSLYACYCFSAVSLLHYGL